MAAKALIVVLLATVTLASALEVPPSWAMHGALGARFPARAPSNIAPQIFNAPLDWFNTSNSRTIPVRYWVDTSCASSEGPLFVYMGGEAAAQAHPCNAQDRNHGATVVQVEHRFYGESVPAGDLADENIRFLTVEQNLKDTAAITQAVQKSMKSKKVAAFGGSYSGATCAYFRIAYPDLVDACISSSGVVHAITEFVGFDEQVAAAIAIPEQSCAVALGEAYAAIDRLFDGGHADELKTLFNASNLIGTVHGDIDFMYAAADGPAMLDQYGSKDILCNGLKQLPQKADDMSRAENLAAVIAHGYGTSFMSQCFYDSECLKKSQAPTSGVGARQWRWQKCAEMAFLQSAPQNGTPMRSRKLTIEALIDQCHYVFGPASHLPDVPASDAIDLRYGGDHPKGTNIFFFDFSDDPWQRASVNHTISPELPYCMTTCDGCGHCGAGVPSSLTKCFVEAETYLTKWLKESKSDLAVL